jgi:hypothetical protein
MIFRFSDIFAHDKLINVFTEHRKQSAAMEKCPHCFEKVPKHLIIAIGLKVYSAII